LTRKQAILVSIVAPVLLVVVILIFGGAW